MADTLDDWDAVATYALALPGTERSTSYGQPAIKVRGKMLVSLGHVAGSFHVIATHEEKSLLMETDPTPSGRPRITRAGPGCSSASAAPIRIACAR